ncbi:hypothetical protein QQ020_28810 [Fulvivirgaceae bacterium BMA12]|uniref:Class I SAM-dependent methyltransferase n=1 Tax=Agaribacillus aureus TaxID=3051825 RepID=A0ABT8LIK5_9BACT|nr:hypothetical protein [Fulvivirgaceae bacterium BMA12]
MARIHLFEFEDLQWFPTFLRNYGTDFLQFLANKTKMYKPVIPLLEKAIQKSGNYQIVDLGSGGGGGLLWLNEALKETYPELKILLTDYYPNIAAFEYTKNQADNFEYISTPVDARDVPSTLNGLRTQFLSLHHFQPRDAGKILQNAVNSGNPIAVFEAQERSFLSLLAMFFSPISVLFTTPFIRPFKFGRILFTYFIPIVPLFVLWDGIVSSLRTYSVEEMKKLISNVENQDDFDWETGRIKSGPGVILYLIGSHKN